MNKTPLTDAESIRLNGTTTESYTTGMTRFAMEFEINLDAIRRVLQRNLTPIHKMEKIGIILSANAKENA